MNGVYLVMANNGVGPVHSAFETKSDADDECAHRQRCSNLWRDGGRWAVVYVPVCPDLSEPEHADIQSDGAAA